MGLQSAATEIAKMQSVDPCCADLRDVSFFPIGVERETYRLPQNHRVTREFHGNSSYFLPFEIPRDSGSQTIVLRSAIMSDGYGNGIGRIFVPKLRFYDREFDRVGSVVEPGMCYLQRWSEVGFYMTIEVDPKETPYGLVYTSDFNERALFSYSNSATFGAGGIVSTSTSTIRHAITAAGHLDISMAQQDDPVVKKLKGKCHVSLLK